MKIVSQLIRKSTTWLLATAVTFGIAIAAASAADVTWNNGSTDFTWNTTSVNWSGAAWNNANLDGAIFGATGAGTINLPGAINLRSLNFNANGYTINGAGSLNFNPAGTSTLAGTQINVGTGFTANLNTAVNSLFGINKVGSGNLVVSGLGAGVTGGTQAPFNSDFAGHIYIGTGTASTASGTLTLANATAIPSNTIVMLGGGNLDIGANNVTISRLIIQNLNASGSATGQVNGAGQLTVSSNEIFVQGNSTGFGERFNAGLNIPSGVQLVRVGSGGNGANEVIFNNVISGNGGFTKSWGFTSTGLPTSLGGFTIAGNNTYTGPTSISGGTSNILGGSSQSSSLSVASGTATIIGANGGFGAATAVNIVSGGTLLLDNTASVTAGSIAVGIPAANVSNRLNTAASLNLDTVGAFQITGAAGVASDQQFASINSQVGNNFLTLNLNTTTFGTSILNTPGNLTISNGATLQFRSTTMPLTTAVAQASTAFTVAGTTPAEVGGIMVGATGNASATNAYLNTGTDFVRYVAANNVGVARLDPAEYNSVDFSGGNVTRSAAATVAAPSTINSLRSTASHTLTLNAPLTISSGMILSQGGTTLTLAGTSGVDFGANRGYIFGALTAGANNPISGSGGLTKATNNTVTINSSLAGLTGGIQVQFGTLTFATTTNATAFGGPLDIQAGVVNFNVADSGTGAVNIGSANSPANATVLGASLNLNNAAVTSFSRAINVLGNGGAQQTTSATTPLGLALGTLATASTTQNISSAISLNNNLSIIGGGTSTVLNLTGPITGNSGIYSAYATGTMNVTNAGNNFNGDFWHTGTGTVNFAGSANAGTGGLKMTSGTVAVSAGNNIGSGQITLMGGTFRTDAAINFAQNFNIAAASTLNTNGFNVGIGSLNGSVTSGTVLTKSGLGTLTITGNSSFNGALTMGTGAGTVTLNSNGALPRLGTMTVGNSGTFNVDNSVVNLPNRTGFTTNLTSTNSGVAGTGQSINLTTNAAGSTFNFGTLTVTGGVLADPNVTAFNVNDGGAGTNSITFMNLAAVAANNTLNIVGSTNLGLDVAGPSSRIFFVTPPTLTAGIISNVNFTGFGGSGQATYDPQLGVILFVAPSAVMGTFIDNINNVGPGSITSKNALFTTTGDTTANLGAKINSLVMDAGNSVNLVQVYAPQAGNANTAMDTLLLSAGNLTSQNGDKSITAATTGIVTFGTTGPANITTTSNLTIGNGVTLSTALGLTKNGAGTLTFGAGSTNAITGPYNITAGSVVLNGNATTSSLTSTAGTTLDIGGSTFTANQSGASTAAGNIIGAGALTKQGAGVLTLTGTNAMGTINVFGGSVAVNADAALGSTTGTVNLDNGALAFTAAFTPNPTRAVVLGAGGGAIDTAALTVNFNTSMTGVGSLAKIGTGTLVLGATQAYGGSTIVAQGVLNNGINNALPTANALIVGNPLANENSAVYALNGFDQTVPNLSIVAKSSGGAAARLVLGGNTLTVNGTLALVDNAVVPGNAFPVTVSSTVGGNINLGGAVRDLNVAANNNSGGDLLINASIINGGINYTGTNSVSVANTPARVLFGASNTYAGGTTINSGTLIVGATFAMADPSGALTVNTTGPTGTNSLLTLNSSQTVGSLAGSVSGGGTATINFAAAGTLTVNQSTNTSYAGVLSGTGGALTKTGAGTLTLTGTNTYTGGTQVNGGRLNVNNTTGSGTGTGAVTVGGGTLGGNGTISGAVTVNSGVLAPGTSPGLLTVGGGVTFAGGTFEVELQGTAAGTQYDQLRVTSGNIALGAGTTSISVLPSGYTPALTDVFVVINNTGAGTLSGTFAGFGDQSVVASNVLGSGIDYLIWYGSYTGFGTSVVIAPVPEPATVLGICALGFGAVKVIRRRFKKTTAAL